VAAVIPVAIAGVAVFLEAVVVTPVATAAAAC
jgi:hypothetical protein